MTRRTRKFIGTFLLLILVMAYGPLVMALAESRIIETPKWVQAIAYIVLGLGWVIPALPLVRWMQKPDVEG
jgi:predicted membrane channel-forming protein YqfA (hemolysin III family)